eukprot:248104-Prymnesium_polylepis.1
MLYHSGGAGGLRHGSERAIRLSEPLSTSRSRRWSAARHPPRGPASAPRVEWRRTAEAPAG